MIVVGRAIGNEREKSKERVRSVVMLPGERCHVAGVVVPVRSGTGSYNYLHRKYDAQYTEYGTRIKHFVS